MARTLLGVRHHLSPAVNNQHVRGKGPLMGIGSVIRHRRHRLVLACALVVVASMSPLAAHAASLMGDSVGCSFTGGSFVCVPGTATVVAGSELQIGIVDVKTWIFIDVAETSVTFTA